MAATLLADLDQTSLDREGLGHHLLATVSDGDLDPASRDAVRALVRLWPCGDHVYFCISASAVEVSA